MPHKVRELATTGLGRCFKVTLQTRAPENFRSRRWGAERRVSRAQTRERGPPSAWAEILVLLLLLVLFIPNAQYSGLFALIIIHLLYLYNCLEFINKFHLPLNIGLSNRIFHGMNNFCFIFILSFVFLTRSLFSINNLASISVNPWSLSSSGNQCLKLAQYNFCKLELFDYIPFLCVINM